MNWCLISVFIYTSALMHFCADFLSHWMGKKGLLLILHAALYTVFFILIFWFFKISYWWLILIFGSHATIDSQGKLLLRIVRQILKKSEVSEPMELIIVLGLDQVLHLTIPLIIALLTL